MISECAQCNIQFNPPEEYDELACPGCGSNDIIVDVEATDADLMEDQAQ